MKLENAKEKIIQVCADYFNDCIKENGFEDFKEMKESYSWDSDDIRAEVDSVITSYLNKLYFDGVEFDASCHDDTSITIHENGWIEMSYRELKKEIFKLVK
jgi:hypothetical protein